METEYLTRDLVAHEIRRWLDMHEVAKTIFDGLPPDQQETIRRDGQPITTPLAMLVGCKPEVRMLADTILRVALACCEGSLSQGALMVDTKTETDEGSGVGDREIEERLEAMEARIERLSELASELVVLLESHPQSSPR